MKEEFIKMSENIINKCVLVLESPTSSGDARYSAIYTMMNELKKLKEAWDSIGWSKEGWPSFHEIFNNKSDV